MISSAIVRTQFLFAYLVHFNYLVCLKTISYYKLLEKFRAHLRLGNIYSIATKMTGVWYILYVKSSMTYSCSVRIVLPTLNLLFRSYS
jgi:hypothetical protein